MNRYQPRTPYSQVEYDEHSNYMRGRSMDNRQTSHTIIDDLRNFTQNRPGLALAGALLGGFLLTRYLLSNERSAMDHGREMGYRPMWSYAPHQDKALQHSHQHQVRHPMSHRPADHMGATEDQMSDRFADPSQDALEEGARGTTGAVYELDRDSITAG